MKTIIAKQGDRFDTLFAREYGGRIYQNGYKKGYNAFILANVKYIDFPVFAGGEVIICPVWDDEVEEKGGGIWE